MQNHDEENIQILNKGRVNIIIFPLSQALKWLIMAFQNSKISKLLMEKAEEYEMFTNNIKDLNVS